MMVPNEVNYMCETEDHCCVKTTPLSRAHTSANAQHSPLLLDKIEHPEACGL